MALRFQDEEEAMACVICRQGEMHPGEVTVTLQRNDTIIVLKGVPAEVCDNCGEYYLSEAVTGIVLAKAEDAVKRGAEVEILRFAA
jgi:YgiT-type zinc finger domain-containing protein